MPSLPGSQDKLDQLPAVAKSISKNDATSTKDSSDFRKKLLKTETTKCEGKLGDSWQCYLDHHFKLIAVTNLGALF